MKARYLVVGDPVVTSADTMLVANGAVVVEGSEIVAVGPRESLERLGPFDRVIGSPSHLVMPGFINCHYHTETAIGPGLIQFIFEKANMYMTGPDAVDEDDLRTAALVGLINCVRGGQTATLDVYYGKRAMPLFGAESVLAAYEDIGMRTALGLVVRDRNKYVHAPNEGFLELLPAELAREVAESPMGYAWPVDDVMAAYGSLATRWDGRHGRIRTILAPDWTPACSDELYRLCRQKADEYATGYTTHVLETRSEMLFNLESHGKTAVRRLADLEVLGPDVSFAHFVWATDEDIEIFSDSGVVASCNPGSNLRLSTGICRVRDILAAGGRVAFGTDGISFSDDEDFFQELRLAGYLQRLPRDFPEGRLESEAVLRSAWTNGARAVRFEDRVGKLAPGYYADLLVVSKERILAPPARYASEPVLDVLLDRANATDIALSMIHGNVVMEDGELTNVDEKTARAALAEAVDRRLYVLSRAEQRWSELANLVMPYVVDFYRPAYEKQLDAAYVYNLRRPPSPGS